MRCRCCRCGGAVFGSPLVTMFSPVPCLIMPAMPFHPSTLFLLPAFLIAPVLRKPVVVHETTVLVALPLAPTAPPLAVYRRLYRP